MSWIGIGGTVVTSGISLAKSASDKHEAKKLAKDNARPAEGVPQGIQDSVEIARMLATQGLSGVSLAASKRDIARSGATALASATNKKSGNQTVGAIEQGTNDALLDLEVKDSQARGANMQNLQQQNQLLGNWQNQIWQWNSKNKYEENAAAIRALNTSSQENLNAGIESGLTGAMTTASAITKQNPAQLIHPEGAGGGAPGTATATSGMPTVQGLIKGFDASHPVGDPTADPALFSAANPQGLISYLTKYKMAAGNN
jgi:hypothetical protein